MRRTRRRVAVCLLALLWLVPAAPTPASAGLVGTTAPAVPATTTKWSAVVSTAAATEETSGALTVGFTSVSFISFSNNGKAELGSRYTLRLPMTSTNGATGSLQECVGGVWDESLNSCSGTVTTVATVGGTNDYSLSTPIPAGSSKRLRVNPNMLNMPGSTATIQVEVRRKLSTEA